MFVSKKKYKAALERIDQLEQARIQNNEVVKRLLNNIETLKKQFEELGKASSELEDEQAKIIQRLKDENHELREKLKRYVKFAKGDK